MDPKVERTRSVWTLNTLCTWSCSRISIETCRSMGCVREYQSRISLTHTARKSLENQLSNTNSIVTKTQTPSLEHRYKDLIRTTGRRDVIVMRGVTVINPRWLPKLASNTPMLHNSGPLDEPPPSFDLKRDRLRCYVAYHYGPHRWSLPLQMEDFPNSSTKRYTWFARLLLEGSIVPVFRNLRPYYRCQPREITMSSGGSSAKRVLAVLSPLREADADMHKTRLGLSTNPKFLQKAIRHC